MQRPSSRFDSKRSYADCNRRSCNASSNARTNALSHARAGNFDASAVSYRVCRLSVCHKQHGHLDDLLGREKHRY